jgi:hypothetical protein
VPIDPRIPLGVNPPQPIDVTRGFEQGARLSRLAAITEQERAEMALKQREVAEQEQIRAALQESQGDIEKALPKIRQIAPMTALKIEGVYNESRSAKLKLAQNRLAHDLEATEYVARQLNGVTDQQSYDYARAAIAGAGLPVEGMNPQYDPQYVEGLKAKGLSVKEQLDLKKAEIDRLFQERKFQAEHQDKTADNERQSARDAETRRHNRVMENKPTATDNALVAIVGPDGKPVLVPRSQAVGKTPASTRDSGGGRGVTSGDANRLADFDTSLDDVKVLRDTVSGNQSTGTKAAIGAALPNWVTEMTGRGESAKQKQAVIDRVKQVIGKALEGGVLRKEDEHKYTKILPTISDPPAVVKAKLDGLEAALIQRKSTLIDSLDDAGYNTDAYRSRSGNRTKPGPKADPLGIR